LQYFISSIPFYSFSFFLGSLCFCIQTKELLPIHLSPIIFLSVYIANSKTSNNNNNKALSHIYIPLVAGSHKPGWDQLWMVESHPAGSAHSPLAR